MEEHSRDRIKKWSCWTADAENIDFPHAAQAACIRRDVFEISGGRTSREYALILTSRKAGKMTAADVSRHTRGHWGIEIRITGSATPYTGKTTARPGPGTARTLSPHSATSHSGYSA